MKLNNLFLAIIVLLVSCSQPSGKQPQNNSLKDSVLVAEQGPKFDDRLFVVGDFNGDGIKDTIFESYISSLTNKETPKKFANEELDKSIDLIIKNQPVTKLYTHTAGVDTFIVTKEYQQSGMNCLINLGDLDGDKTDEFGYMIQWADYSNLNTYYIGKIKQNNFVKLFNFPINEAVNFDEVNMLDNKYLIKLVSPKTIEYKFFSDSATIETGKHAFD
jgi:hypothetical protein